MGIRSEVVACFKNEAYQGLSDEAKGTIKEYFGDYVERGPEGLLFYVDYVKWYDSSYPDLISLYKELFEAEEDDFLIVVATPEHPNDDESDIGGWYDNPWNVYKSVSVSVEWEKS
tara:strand:- start:215 stop:559 length:345 start_codon:yes stop_codon:yes gene_type:complete